MGNLAYVTSLNVRNCVLKGKTAELSSFRPLQCPIPRMYTLQTTNKAIAQNFNFSMRTFFSFKLNLHSPQWERKTLWMIFVEVFCWHHCLNISRCFVETPLFSCKINLKMCLLCILFFWHQKETVSVSMQRTFCNWSWLRSSSRRCWSC